MKSKRISKRYIIVVVEYLFSRKQSSVKANICMNNYLTLRIELQRPLFLKISLSYMHSMMFLPTYKYISVFWKLIRRRYKFSRLQTEVDRMKKNEDGLSLVLPFKYLMHCGYALAFVESRPRLPVLARPGYEIWVTSIHLSEAG